MSQLTNDKLTELLDACIRGKRSGQKELYQKFFGYAMSICLRYASSKEEAQEILNDGFLKVFTKLHSFNREKPFQMWLRRIMINTAIDYYRKRNKIGQAIDINQAQGMPNQTNTLDIISEQEILALVQQLPPSYRLVFNLYVIEGYKHDEIAERLGIHVGTSKSNLAKARKHLQGLLQKISY